MWRRQEKRKTKIKSQYAVLRRCHLLTIILRKKTKMKRESHPLTAVSTGHMIRGHMVIM